MKIQLNKEQSKVFLEMVIPELIRIEKERQAKKRKGNNHESANR